MSRSYALRKSSYTLVHVRSRLGIPDYLSYKITQEKQPEIAKGLLRIYEEVFPHVDELSAISYLIRAEIVLMSGGTDVVSFCDVFLLLTIMYATFRTNLTL